MDGEAADALFSRQVDRQQLAALGERAAALQAENAALRARHAARELETHEFVAYFQKEIQARDRVVSRLGEELAAAKAALAAGLEAAALERERAAQAAARDVGEREQRLRAQLAAARDELQQLEAFRDVREAQGASLRALEARLASEQAAAREALAALERKFIEERARLLRAHDKHVEEAAAQAKEAARHGLDADSRKVAADNRRMGEELRVLLQATDELQRERQALQASAGRLQRELDAALATEHERARQARRQARDLAQLKAELRAGEQRAGEQRAAAERAADARQSRGQREREDLQLDADALRRLLRLKNKELRGLRRLAQAVLDQRSDVEQFLLDALTHVRSEAAQERARADQRAREHFQADMRRFAGLPPPISNNSSSSSSSVKFPALAASEPPVAPAPDGSVDLRQLSWEDKERVLRLVFARINGAQGRAEPPGGDRQDAGGREDVDGREADDADGREDEDEDADASLERGNNGGHVVYFATEAVADPADRGEAKRAAGPGEASMALTGLPLVARAPVKPTRPAR